MATSILAVPSPGRICSCSSSCGVSRTVEPSYAQFLPTARAAGIQQRWQIQVRRGYSSVGGRRGRNVACEVAVEIGDSQSTGQQGTNNLVPGAKIKVIVPMTVYHVGKLPNLNMEGMEGVVKDVLRVYKGKTISANLPVKAQFFKELDGSTVKFFAHFREDEVEVVE